MHAKSWLVAITFRYGKISGELAIMSQDFSSKNVKNEKNQKSTNFTSEVIYGQLLLYMCLPASKMTCRVTRRAYTCALKE